MLQPYRPKATPTNKKAKTETKTQEVPRTMCLHTGCFNLYRLKCPLAHDIHCPHEDKDKDPTYMLYFWEAGGSRISNITF